jgi:hypothetical protein
MVSHIKFFGLVAGILFTTAAPAGQWFALAGPDVEATVVEVDLTTVRALANNGESVIRVTHDVLQPHPAGFGYRSFIATAQFDCVRRTMSLASAAYFALPAATGQRLGADSAGGQGGLPPKLLDSIPLAARQALLKAACATGQPN